MQVRSTSLDRVLRLEVLDYAGPARWRWRLTSAAGAFLADHQVALDPSSWQHEALLDLQRYLRSYTAPDRRREQEIDLLARIGDWLASSALGPVADELARHRGAVRVVEGERVPELWEGQMPLAYGIVRGALGRLGGGA